MTAEQIIYDILEIKNSLTDDSDFSPEHILHKVNSYRSIFIRQMYDENGFVESHWFQELPKFTFEKITSSDEPSITVSSITLGKYVLPSIVPLPNNLGCRVLVSSRQVEFSPIDFFELMFKLDVEGHVYKEYGWVSSMGNTVYIFPYFKEGKAQIIADNPMDVQILDDGVWRDRLVSDSYPIDYGTAQRIILEILTKDLSINLQSIGDLTNDAQSQLKILQDASGNQNR